MSGDTILTMANFAGIDLDAVKASDIHFPTLAEHLAKENRFNGATPNVAYSVAQHLCVGADAMLEAGRSETEAAYFIIHDGPEGLWKDDPTPKKKTLAQRIERKCGVTSQSILDVLAEIDDEHEAAVHQAAGLPWPIPQEIKKVVKKFDLIMFVTEWRDLMKGAPHPNWSPYSGIKPLSKTIVPWGWWTARFELNFRMHQLLPSLKQAEH